MTTHPTPLPVSPHPTEASKKPWFHSWKWPSLSTQILIALVLGIVTGMVVPAFATAIKPLSTLFLHMIKMLIAPLVFSTLVVGIAGAGDKKKIGSLGLKTLLYFEIATTVALVIGLAVANWLQPGAGMDLTLGAGNIEALSTIQQNTQVVQHHSFWDTLVDMVPTSIFQAMATGNVLQIVVFSVFFALALMASGDRGKPILLGLESLAEVMFKFVGYVMLFAPLGVFAAVASAIGQQGIGILATYAKLTFSLYFALALFVFSTLFTACSIIKVPFVKMLQAIREPFLIAFSTANSESALPKAMRIMERFGVPKQIVSFVMPTGYTFNLDGSTLYLALATLFVAQMAHVELSIWQQLQILLTLMLTSKGVAAVPRASLVILASTLVSYGLPMEGVAVILGIDHFLDMGRTSVNLVGNCVATAVVARWEGVFNDEKMHRFDPRNDDEASQPPDLEEDTCPLADELDQYYHTPPTPKANNMQLVL
ncbi:MAG: dicarboxylate/amino acid:cation symporter [Vampirovibrionales bacterium]